MDDEDDDDDVQGQEEVKLKLVVYSYNGTLRRCIDGTTPREPIGTK